MALTHENIHNSSNSIVIDIKEQENSEDEKSLDYSQFAPSSKETDDRSFIGSIGSMLESEFSKSTTSTNTVSKKKSSDKVTGNARKLSAVICIQYAWKKYRKRDKNK